MDDDIHDHEGDPLGVFSVMSDIGFEGFLIQLWIHFSPTSWAFDTRGCDEKGIVGMRYKKLIFTAIPIDQNESHRQIELETFIVTDVRHEIQGLIDVVEPTILLQGKGERKSPHSPDWSDGGWKWGLYCHAARHSTSRLRNRNEVPWVDKPWHCPYVQVGGATVLLC